MAKIISVLSGKGGTGKSTISAALVQSLAKLDKRVLAVDLDIGLRSLDLLLGLENKIVFDLGDVLDGKCPPAAAIVSHDRIKGLSLLCAPNQVPKSFSSQAVTALLRSLSASFDYILLDMPAGLGISVILARELCDLNLIVTLPESATLRDTRKISDILAAGTSKPCQLVINRVSWRTLQISGIRDLDEIMDTVGLPLLAVIPEDEWINAPQEMKKHTKVSGLTPKIFDAMAARLTGQYVPILLQRSHLK